MKVNPWYHHTASDFEFMYELGPNCKPGVNIELLHCFALAEHDSNPPC